ncbi:MAG: hypothetical protein ACO1QB_01250 [Verrucomicrobiales bacterium]
MHKRLKPLLWGAAFLLFATFVYVASVGPAFYIGVRWQLDGTLFEKAFLIFYKPLYRLNSVNGPLEHYYEWWQDKAMNYQRNSQNKLEQQ